MLTKSKDISSNIKQMSNNLAALFLMSLLAPIFTSVEVRKPLSKQNVMVIHNIRNFQVTHLGMLRQLSDTFKKLFVLSVKSIKNKLIERGESKYDLVIIACPTHQQAHQLMQSVKLFRFYDEGGSVLLLSNSHPSGQFRKVLNNFGFDMTGPDNSSEVNPRDIKRRFVSLRTRPSDPWVFVPKNDILLGGLAKGISHGIYFKGATITMTIFENNFSWPLIASPKTSFLHFLPNHVSEDKFKFGIKRKILDPERNSILAGAQKEDSMSRIAVFGGFEVFSNEAIGKSKGENLKLLANLIKWLQFKTHILEVDYFRVCRDTPQKQSNPEHKPKFKGNNSPKKNMRVYFDFDEPHSTKGGWDRLR